MMKEKTMAKAAGKRRPCRICHHWFTPNPRVKDRQMTCGNPGCKRQWHRRKCAEWNRRNAEYFRANYLHKKIEGRAHPNRGSPIPSMGSISRSRAPTGLPLEQVQEEIGATLLIILEYFAQLLIRRFHDALRAQGTAAPTG